MNFKFLLLEAVRNLRANRGRSLLTILGILIGVSSVITMTSLGLGVRRVLNNQLSDLGTDEIYVYAGNFSSAGIYMAPLTKSDMEAVCSLPGIKYCTPQLFLERVGVGADGNSTSLTVNGYNELYYQNEKRYLLSGRNYLRSEVDSAALVALIDESALAKLFPNETSESVLGKKVKIDKFSFEVIGVLKNSSNNSYMGGMTSVTVPYTAISLRLSPEGRKDVEQFIAYLDPAITTPEKAFDEITKALRMRHQLFGDDPNDFTVQLASEFIETTNNIMTSFVIFLGGVAAISLLVGGIGIMNIMLVVVTERTREIGLRKAIGAKQGDIRLQFLFESAILSLFGGLVGILIGVSLSLGFAVLLRNLGEGMENFAAVIKIWVLLSALAFSAAFGLFFGWYPANRASKLEPVIALRSE